jgi:cation transport ATPase
MKKIIIILLTVLTVNAVQAQEKKESKIIETSFKVDGVCGECKERIEDAAMHTKGVKTASWDKKTKMLDLVYNSSKVDITAIKLAVAAKGHDSEDHKSDTTVYSKLPGCCKYKDGAKCHSK